MGTSRKLQQPRNLCQLPHPPTARHLAKITELGDLTDHHAVKVYSCQGLSFSTQHAEKVSDMNALTKPNTTKTKSFGVQNTKRGTNQPEQFQLRLKDSDSTLPQKCPGTAPVTHRSCSPPMSCILLRWPFLELVFVLLFRVSYGWLENGQS